MEYLSQVVNRQVKPRLESEENIVEVREEETLTAVQEALLKLTRGGRLIVTGRSTMGKTTLAVKIITQCLMKRVQRCYACCPTFYNQDALAPLRNIPGAFPRSRVFTRVNDDCFNHIFKQLSDKPAPTLLFVDDAAAESATNKGNKGAFSRLCLAAPHLQLFIVGVFQRLSSASPALRDNAEGVISFRPTRVRDVDILVDEFNAFPARMDNKMLLRKILDTCWTKARFAFIWRNGFPAFDTRYYCGFNSEVNVCDETSP